MAAQVQLHNMHQDRDETICSFGARLHSQAGVCKFLVTHPNYNTEVNYTVSLLRDVSTHGLAYSEIQLDLLGDRNQDMSLEEVLQFIDAKEVGKQSVSCLSQSQGVDAAHSQYSCAKHHKIKHLKAGDNEPSSYCNKHGYGGRALTRMRRTDCPATSVGNRTTLQACVTARANPPGPSNPLHLMAILGKQKVPYLTHSTLQPALVMIQAKASSHLTITCTVTTGHSSRRLHSIGIQTPNITADTTVVRLCYGQHGLPELLSQHKGHPFSPPV